MLLNNSITNAIKYRETANFWNDLDDQFQGEYSVNYLMQKKHELLAAHRFNKDINFILDNLPAKKHRLLDIGCGTGNFLRKLASNFNYSEGVDISSASIAIARKRLKSVKGVKIHCGNVIDIALTHKLDLVNIGELFVYLNDKDIVNVLKKIRYFIEDNGVITLRESVANESTFILVRKNHKTIRRTINHYKKLFKAAGLKIKKMQPNYDYNYAWIAALVLNIFPVFLKSKMFVDFYMNNRVIRFLCLYLPFRLFTIIKPNHICQYYFVLAK